MITSLDALPIRTRLSLLQAASLCILLLGFGALFHEFFDHTVMVLLDDSLKTTAVSLGDSVSHNASAQSPSHAMSPWPAKSLPLSQDGHSFRFFQLGTASEEEARQEKALMHLSEAALLRARQGLSTYETFSVNGLPHFRQLTLPLFPKGHYANTVVQVGAPLTQLRMLQRSVNILLYILLPVILVIMAFLGYFFTGQALRPVAKMIEGANCIQGSALHVRLEEPRADDEIRALAKTFNCVLSQLEDSIGRLRRFSSDVSHELRTPLAVLQAEAELSLRRERRPEEYRETLKTILTETRHMAKMVEDLLLYARADTQTMSLDYKTVSLKDFLEVIVQNVSSAFATKGIAVKWELEGTDSLVCAEAYLALALKNIISNAFKYTPEGGEITIIAHVDADRAMISVKDTGIGIAAKDLPFVFDPFFRSDHSRNRDIGGVGIGLALTKSLVQLHQGSLHVRSILGQGSEFRIKLPQQGASCG